MSRRSHNANRLAAGWRSSVPAGRAWLSVIGYLLAFAMVLALAGSLSGCAGAYVKGGASIDEQGQFQGGQVEFVLPLPGGFRK